MNIFDLFHSQFKQTTKLNRSAKFFLLALFLDGFMFAAFNLFFNFYILADGHNREFLGLLNAMPLLAAILLGLPMGMLSDRIGCKISMLIGLTLANIGIVAMLLVHQPGIMLFLSFSWGAAAQLYFLSQVPFMMKVSDDSNRDLLFSLSFGVFPLASTFGNILAGYLPGIFSNLLQLPSDNAAVYQFIMVICVIASFVVLVPIMFIKEPKSVNQTLDNRIQPIKISSLWGILKRPLTVKLILPPLIIGLGSGLLIPYLNLFFAEHYQMSDQNLGILFAGSSFLIGIATFIGPRLVGNVGGKIRMIVFSQGISIFFMIVLGFSPFAWLAVMAFLARDTLMNMASPLYDAFAMECTSENEHGTVNSMRILAGNFGWAIGLYFSGIIQNREGFSPLFIATSILYTIGIVLTWKFFSEGQKLNFQSSPTD
jgi:MFS family permease